VPIQFTDLNHEQTRRQFRRFTDYELLSAGQKLQRFCSQKDPNPAFAKQLQVARESGSSAIAGGEAALGLRVPRARKKRL
jgi:hypothetical protein